MQPFEKTKGARIEGGNANSKQTAFTSNNPCGHSFWVRSGRLGHHLAADYTIMMSRTLKDNHVMYNSGA